MSQSYHRYRMTVWALMADIILWGNFKSAEAVVLEICLMPLRNDLICSSTSYFAFHISDGGNSTINQCTKEMT